MAGVGDVSISGVLGYAIRGTRVWISGVRGHAYPGYEGMNTGYEGMNIRGTRA